MLFFLISDQRWKALSLAQCKVANHSVSVELQAGAADVDEVGAAELEEIGAEDELAESKLKSIEISWK